MHQPTQIVVMNEAVFLDGKVRKRSLPVFHGPPPGNTGGLKRLLLSQGELASLYDGEEGIHYIAYIEMRAGEIRGNHLHRIKKEHIYLVEGRLQLAIKLGGEGALVFIEVEPGDLVTIDPGVVHAMKPFEAGFAIEFSPAHFDPTDVQRFKLL
jgi:mannose-6-phosphate isomerase-like protein (cupin superfamily)